MGNSQSTVLNERIAQSAKYLPSPFRQAGGLVAAAIRLPERSAAALKCPVRLTIEDYRKECDNMEIKLNAQDQLKQTMEKVVSDITCNIAAMQECCDMIGAVDNVPGELRPMQRLLTSAREHWEMMSPSVNKFSALANSIFEKHSLIIDLSQDELATEVDACKQLLKELGVLKSSLLQMNNELKEKWADVQKRLERLASSMKQQEESLKRDKVLLIGKGCFAALGVLLSAGLLGLVFWKLGSEAGKVALDTAGGAVPRVGNFCASFMDDVNAVNAKLKSIRECQERLKAVGSMELPVLEMIQVIEGMMSESNECRKRMKKRLADAIRNKLEIENLKENDIRQKQEIENKNENDIRQKQEIEKLKENDIRQKQEIEELKKKLAQQSAGSS